MSRNDCPYFVLCYAQRHQLFTDAFFMPCRVHQDGIAVNDIAVCVNKLERLSIDTKEIKS